MDTLFPTLRAPGAFNPWMAPMGYPSSCPNCQAAPQPGLGMPNLAGMETMLLAQLVGMLVQLMSSNSQGGGLFSPPAGTNAGGGGSGDAGGGGSFNSSSGQAVDPSQFQGGTENSRRLAAAALKEATDGDSQGGWCSRDVGEALRSVGLGVARGDAWTKAAVLAGDPRFKEIRVAPNEIDRLPPGAIIVWDKGPGLPYGHISIALGDGREASDLLKKQMHLKTNFRVFMPL